MRERGTIITLIWLDKGETCPRRYESYTCPSALYEKHSEEELGMARKTLLNKLGRLDKDGTPIVVQSPKNPNVRIVKTILYGKASNRTEE